MCFVFTDGLEQPGMIKSRIYRRAFAGRCQTYPCGNITMTNTFAKETLPISLEEEMRHSYLDYAMSVIVG